MTSSYDGLEPDLDEIRKNNNYKLRLFMFVHVKT